VEEVAEGASPFGDPRKICVYMSYKNNKKKKNFLNQLNRQVVLIRIALLKKYSLFIQKNKLTMQQRQTTNTMQWLRDQCKMVRSNNMRISDWVDTYIDSCIENGKPIELLTQYCLSKDLEKRYQLQGNQFIPLQAEIKLFTKEIPRIMDIFASNNISVNWFVTFNDSFIEKGRVDVSIANAYIVMISNIQENKNIIFLNWEKDILCDRPRPSEVVLGDFFSYVTRDAYNIAMNDLVSRTEKFSDFDEIKSGFAEGLQFKIACEAEEGRFLIEEKVGMFDDPGKFILVPLELPERYVFFNTLVPDFQKKNRTNIEAISMANKFITM
jgi:hypothetical protein